MNIIRTRIQAPRREITIIENASIGTLRSSSFYGKAIFSVEVADDNFEYRYAVEFEEADAKKLVETLCMSDKGKDMMRAALEKVEE